MWTVYKPLNSYFHKVEGGDAEGEVENTHSLPLLYPLILATSENALKIKGLGKETDDGVGWGVQILKHPGPNPKYNF